MDKPLDAMSQTVSVRIAKAHPDAHADGSTVTLEPQAVIDEYGSPGTAPVPWVHDAVAGEGVAH